MKSKVMIENLERKALRSIHLSLLLRRGRCPARKWISVLRGCVRKPGRLGAGFHHNCCANDNNDDHDDRHDEARLPARFDNSRRRWSHD